MFFLRSTGVAGNSGSTCSTENQCCSDNKLWSYNIVRGFFSQDRGKPWQPVGSTVDKQNWKLLTLDGQVRLGSYSNNLEWDNVWWERGPVIREPTTGNVLGMPAGKSSTEVDYTLRLHGDTPPTNTSFQSWTLLAPADLSTSRTTQGVSLTPSPESITVMVSDPVAPCCTRSLHMHMPKWCTLTNACMHG